MYNPHLGPDYVEVMKNLEGVNKVIVPFIACGDLRGFDPERNYALDVSMKLF
jgi:tRNA (cytidine32/guanosine34-2'-O)-methyltransferase